MGCSVRSARACDGVTATAAAADQACISTPATVGKDTPATAGGAQRVRAVVAANGQGRVRLRAGAPFGVGITAREDVPEGRPPTHSEPTAAQAQPRRALSRR